MHFTNDYDRDLEKRIWIEQRNKATAAFWDACGHRLRWQSIRFIPIEYRGTYLRCDWCKTEADMYGCIPVHILLCSSCAKRLKSQRRAQRRKNESWKGYSTLYWSQHRYNEMVKEQQEQTSSQ